MILKQFELNWFLFFSLEELVKPLEDYSRWNMEMDLFISQNQKTTLSSTQQWKWISPTTIQETYWKEIHNQFGVLCFQQCWERWREFKKIHFYLPNLSDLKKFMWMIRLKIHVDNPLGWSGVHVDNLDLELWEWRQVVPCGVGWMGRCYKFVMHGCVRWSGGGQVEKWRLTLLYVRLLLPPLAPVFFLVLNGERKLQEKDRDFFNSLLREKRSL